MSKRDQNRAQEEVLARAQRVPTADAAEVSRLRARLAAAEKQLADVTAAQQLSSVSDREYPHDLLAVEVSALRADQSIKERESLNRVPLLAVHAARRTDGEERAPRFDTYHRVSRKGKRAGPEYLTVGLQTSLTRRALETVGGVLNEELLDENLSGSELSKRPQLLRSIARIVSGEIDGLIIPRINRLSRSVEDVRWLARTIADAGGTLISAEERLDLSTPTGIMHLTLLAMFAENELNMVHASWKATRKQNVVDGVGGRPPFGYCKRRDAVWLPAHDRTSPHPGQLVRDETLVGLSAPPGGVPDSSLPSRTHGLHGTPMSRAWWRIQMSEKRRDGWGPQEIADWLTLNGVLTSRGAFFTGAAVTYVLSSETYLGVVRFRSPRIKPDGTPGYDVDEVRVDAHEALVSEELHLACARVRQTRPTRPRGRGKDQVEFLLSGRLRCASCRYAMVPGADRGAKADGSDYLYYHCQRKQSFARCPCGASIERGAIEAFAESLVVRWWEQQQVDFLALPDDDDGTLGAARETVARYEQLCADLVRDYEDLITPEMWGVCVYKQKMADAQAALLTAQSRFTALTMRRGARSPATVDLAARWPSLSREDKRGFITDSIGAIFVKPATRVAADGTRTRVKGQTLQDRLCVLTHEALAELEGGVPTRGRSHYRSVPVPDYLFLPPIRAETDAATAK